MFGLISKIDSKAGKAQELSRILGGVKQHLQSCLAYEILHDRDDDNRLWIVEKWEDEAAHAASLKNQAVLEAITAGRELIAAMERVATLK